MPSFSVPDNDEFAKKYILNHPENEIVFVLEAGREPIKTVDGRELIYPTRFQLVFFSEW